MDWLSHKVPVAINAHIIDKAKGTDVKWMAEGFEAQFLTPLELGQHIEFGRAFAPHFQNGYRKTDNFISCGMFALDYDSEPPTDTYAHTLIQDCATLVYTTVSHTPALPRFRVVFFLEEPVTDVSKYKKLCRYLATLLGSDVAAAKPAQLFFGNRKAELKTFDRGIDRFRFKQLLIDAADSSQTDVPGRPAPGRSRKTLAEGQLVRRAGETGVVSLSDLNSGTQIHCPVHNDVNASAFVVVGKTSAQTRAIHCSACNTTFWPPGDESVFDFNTFETAALMARDWVDRDWNDALGIKSPYEHLFPQRADVGHLRSADLHPIETQYLPDWPIKTGVTLIRSPKGTGKTQFLRRVLAKEHGTVLLVGHRRALIRHLCETLGLDCYLDLDDDTMKVSRRRMGFSLDSLSRAMLDPYDYLILDESEQVLAHFLSDTMADKRSDLIFTLQSHIRRAKHVICLDADLGWTTFRFVNGAGRHPNVSRKSTTTLILNSYAPAKTLPALIYESKDHLIEELRNAAAAGKRLYVTSNSKTQIDKLRLSLSQLVAPELILSITSENSQSPQIRDFLSDVSKKILQYQVVLTSPAVSSGVDISFDDDRPEIDHVFGFFETGINSHFECDQQLARVRNPKAVSVYVSPQRLRFETDLDVVRHSLLVDRLFEVLIDGYDDNGSRKYREDHPLLDLAAGVVSYQRASKNNLRGNFISYRERQGWTLTYVKKDEKKGKAGAEAMSEAGYELEEERTKRLLAARRMTRAQLKQYNRDRDHNLEITPDRRAAADRTFVELFYRRPISGDLILIDRPRFRQAIQLYECLSSPTDWAYMATGDLNDAPLASRTKSDAMRGQFLRDALSEATLYDAKGFDAGLDWNREIDTRDLAGFVAFMKSHGIVYQAQFDCTLREDLDHKPMAQLKAVVGFVGLKLKKVRTFTQNKVKIYQYGWEPEAKELVCSIVRRRALYPEAWVALDEHSADHSPEEEDKSGVY